MPEDNSDIFNHLVRLAEKLRWQYKYAKFNIDFHQSLLAHAVNVASISRSLLETLRKSVSQTAQQDIDFASPKLETLAILTGFLHDVGKDPDKYQQAVRDFLSQKETNPIDFSHQDKPLVEQLSKILLEELSELTGDRDLASQELLEQIAWSVPNLGAKEHAGAVSSGFQGPPSEGAVLCRELAHLADLIASEHTVEEAAKSAARGAQGKYVGGLKFAYHKVLAVRGILTQILHRAVEEIYGGQGYTPIYWFADGTLYAAPKGTPEVNVNQDAIRQEVKQKLRDFLNNVDPYQLAKASYGELQATVIASPEFLFQNEDVIKKFWDYMFSIHSPDKQKVDEAGEYFKMLQAMWPDKQRGELEGYARRFEADYKMLIVLYGIRKALLEGIEKALLERSANRRVFEKDIKNLIEQLKKDTKNLIEQAFHERLGVSTQDWPEVANTTKKEIRVRVAKSLVSSPEYHVRDKWESMLKETLVEITKQYKKVWDQQNPGGDDQIVDSLLADLAYPLPSHDYLVSRLEKQYERFLKGKYVKGKEGGSIVCPLCGGVAESEAQAKLIGNSQIYHDTIAAGSTIQSPNKLWVCRLCEYERKLRTLLLESEQREAILILPQIGLSRDMHQIWQKYASELASEGGDASPLELDEWCRSIWENGEEAFSTKAPKISGDLKREALKKLINRYRQELENVKELVEGEVESDISEEQIIKGLVSGDLQLQPVYQEEFQRELRGYVSTYFSPNYILFLVKANISPRKEAESASEIRLLFLRCLLARLFHACVVDEDSPGDMQRRIGYTPLPRSLGLRTVQQRLGAPRGWVTIDGLGVALRKLSALLLLDKHMSEKQSDYGRDNLLRIIDEEPGRILARITSKKSFFAGTEVLGWLEEWSKKELVLGEVS